MSNKNVVKNIKIPDKQVDIRNEKGQFVKGESGNKDGRPPKEFCIPDILNKLLHQSSKYSADKKTHLELICEKAIDLAEGGDRDARNWVAERTEGKVTDHLKLDANVRHTDFRKKLEEISNKTTEEIIGELNEAIQATKFSTTN